MEMNAFVAMRSDSLQSDFPTVNVINHAKATPSKRAVKNGKLRFIMFRKLDFDFGIILCIHNVALKHMYRINYFELWFFLCVHQSLDSLIK